MEGSAINWKINDRATFVEFRTCFLVITVFSIISTHAFAFSEGSVFYFPLAILMLVYIGLSCLIVKSYRRSKDWCITVKGDFMQIPRLGRRSIQLKLSSVNSMQKYNISKRLMWVMVGQPGRSPIMIERRIFHSEDDFDRCIQILENFSLQNQRTADEIVPDSLRKNKREVRNADFLAVALILSYCCFLDNELSHIDHEIINHAGLSKQLFISGEYYRFFTSFFLHYSPLHLLPNVLTLSIIGRHIITIYGLARFTNIVFFSAISGSLLSLTFSPYQFVLGASGGIFGLIGAHLYACARVPRQLPGSVSASVKAITCMLALQIILDLSGAGGDIFSHLGGGVFGFLYAVCIFRKRSVSEAADPTRAEIYISLILALSLLFSLSYLAR